MKTQTETAVTTATVKKPVKSKLPELAPELQAQFIAYFMQRYPLTKKIKIKRHYDRYLVRVKYRGESPRRAFRVEGRSYEQLVIRTEFSYHIVRGLPWATNG